MSGSNGYPDDQANAAAAVPVWLAGGTGGPSSPLVITTTSGASPPTVQTATIANGASLSAAVDLAGNVLCGIAMPAAWTAAGLTFQASTDNATWLEYTDATGVAIGAVVAQGQFIQLDPSTWAGVRYIKVRSGTLAAAVNQGAARALGLVTKAI